MRFISLLCSLILHIAIIYIATFITQNRLKVDLGKTHTYKINIIKLQPRKETKTKKFYINKKKVKFIKKKSFVNTSKKNIVKIPLKRKKRLKKRPSKIDIKKQQERLVKSALKDILSSLKEEEKKERIIEKEIKSISKDVNQQEDITTEESEDTVEKYKAIAEIKIKDNWRYPVKQPNLSAEVEIEVDKNGNILKTRFIKSSGNSIFDNSVLRAIKETEKLDAPPVTFMRKNKIIVIRITFGREGKK
ncbi:hypothetical protein JCM13304A_00140 [Desulfothermus okinawensis JCM 13304]